MNDGAGPVRVLTPEEIDQIKDKITPVEKIRFFNRFSRVSIPPATTRIISWLKAYRER